MKSNDIPSALHVDHGLWESMLYTILLYSGLISNMHSASAKRESYSSTDQPLAQWRQGRQVLWQVPSGMLSLLKEKLSKIESKRDIAARQRERERERERARVRKNSIDMLLTCTILPVALDLSRLWATCFCKATSLQSCQTVLIAGNRPACRIIHLGALSTWPNDPTIYWNLACYWGLLVCICA